MNFRLDNNVNLRIKGIKADELISEVRDVAFSVGSACSSGLTSPSHVLKAMGLTDEEAYSSVRLSIGRFTLDEEIDEVIKIFNKSIEKIRKHKIGK
jgi:cysteine desulfurase